MTSAKSRRSAAVMDAPVATPTLNRLTMSFCDKPAPTSDGQNLWVEIDVNLRESTALFHCQEREVVGTHKNRKVTYRADQNCQLRFSDDRVFKRDRVNLTAHQQEVLKVDDATSGVGASYSIYAETTPASTTTAASPVIAVLGGPHIVVP